MKLCSFKQLANICNQDIAEEYQKLCSVFQANGLEADKVMATLMDYSKGEDLAEDTINNISKRLSYIASMEPNKTHFEEHHDGWITFGTIHSDKQRYDLKKIEGIWYSKINLSRGDAIGEELAIELNQEAQEKLNQRLA